MAKRKYDISFGIYDVENQDWITEDADMSIEIADDTNISVFDFAPLAQNMIQLIDDYNEKLLEQEKDDEEEEKTKNETQ